MIIKKNMFLKVFEITVRFRKKKFFKHNKLILMIIDDEVAIGPVLQEQ